MQFSLDRKPRSRKRIQCSASDSVGLIFTSSYHSTLLITTPTMTPSLVKTSLKKPSPVPDQNPFAETILFDKNGQNLSSTSDQNGSLELCTSHTLYGLNEGVLPPAGRGGGLTYEKIGDAHHLARGFLESGLPFVNS